MKKINNKNNDNNNKYIKGEYIRVNSNYMCNNSLVGKIKKREISDEKKKN